MKITLVTEHKVIIGELVQAEAAKGGCTCQGCSAPPEPMELLEAMGGRTQVKIRRETHPALVHSHQPIHVCCSDCGPEGHIASSNPLQDADTPLGTPPVALPVAKAALAPCAVGDFMTCTIMVTNIVERNV